MVLRMRVPHRESDSRDKGIGEGDLIAPSIFLSSAVSIIASPAIRFIFHAAQLPRAVLSAVKAPRVRTLFP